MAEFLSAIVERGGSDQEAQDRHMKFKQAPVTALISAIMYSGIVKLAVWLGSDNPLMQTSFLNRIAFWEIVGTSWFVFCLAAFVGEWVSQIDGD